MTTEWLKGNYGWWFRQIGNDIELWVRPHNGAFIAEFELKHQRIITLKGIPTVEQAKQMIEAGVLEWNTKWCTEITQALNPNGAIPPVHEEAIINPS